MGTGHSLTLPRNGLCSLPQRRRESHSSNPPADQMTNHRQRRSLSAAFSLPDTVMDVWSTSSDLVNINTASEEELMTLPGISRQTARNIVDYRKLIGGFRKVEDLALVSGIGATKLSLIRDELCVGRKAASKNSSASSSGVDLSMLDNISRRSFSTLGPGTGGGGGGSQRRLSNATKVNVNTANVFQLMKVQFITQNLAEHIVTHRDRKGPFRCLDDLLKVKGVKVALFSAIRPYLVLSDETDPGGAAGRKHPRNEPKICVNGDDQVNQYDRNQLHRSPYQMDKSRMNDLNYCHISQMNQTPLNHIHLNNNQSHISQTESSQLMIQPQVNQSRRSSMSSMHLLQLPDNSHRPLEPGRRSDSLSGGRTHRTLRLASWNLDKCSLEKAENPGVREVVAMTILENGIDLLAVQDLQNEKALTKLCEELNFLTPLNDSIQTEEGYSSQWQSTSDSTSLHTEKISEESRLGFLYRGDGGLKLISADLVQSPVSRSDQTPTTSVLIAVFEATASFRFCIVNIQIDSSVTENNIANWSMTEVVKIVKLHLAGQGNLPVVFVGFFNASPDHPALAALKEAGYHPVFSSKQFTDISLQNPDGTQCSENLWFDSRLITNCFTGIAGIIRSNLTNPWIPCGWGWGGLVSHHCPIWAEISLASTSASPSLRMLS